MTTTSRIPLAPPSDVSKPRKRPRRSLDEVITDDAVNGLRRYIRMAFDTLARELPPIRDADDEEKRKKLHAQAGAFLQLTALTYLREREPRVFGTLVSSARKAVRSAILSGDAVDFKIVPYRGLRAFWTTVMNVHLLSAYNYLKADLLIPWRTAEQRSVPFIRSHFVTKRGRFGERQKESLAKRSATLEARADALLKAGRPLLNDDVLRQRPLTTRQARRWVREGQTLTRTLHMFLGYLFSKEPRTIKLMLIRARQHEREVAKLPVLASAEADADDFPRSDQSSPS